MSQGKDLINTRRPEAISALRQGIKSLLRNHSALKIGAASSTRKHLAELGEQIENPTNTIATMGLSKALNERLRSVEKERYAIQIESRVDPAISKLPEHIPNLMKNISH